MPHQWLLEWQQDLWHRTLPPLSLALLTPGCSASGRRSSSGDTPSESVPGTALLLPCDGNGPRPPLAITVNGELLQLRGFSDLLYQGVPAPPPRLPPHLHHTFLPACHLCHPCCCHPPPADLSTCPSTDVCPEVAADTNAAPAALTALRQPLPQPSLKAAVAYQSSGEAFARTRHLQCLRSSLRPSLTSQGPTNATCQAYLRSVSIPGRRHVLLARMKADEEDRAACEAGRSFLVQRLHDTSLAAVVIQRAFRAYKARRVQDGRWPALEEVKQREAHSRYLQCEAMRESDGGKLDVLRCLQYKGNKASAEYHGHVLDFAQEALSYAQAAVERLEQRAREGITRPPKSTPGEYCLHDRKLRVLLLGEDYVSMEDQRRAAEEEAAGSLRAGAEKLHTEGEEPPLGASKFGRCTSGALREEAEGKLRSAASLQRLKTEALKLPAIPCPSRDPTSVSDPGSCPGNAAVPLLDPKAKTSSSESSLRARIVGPGQGGSRQSFSGSSSKTGETRSSCSPLLRRSKAFTRNPPVFILSSDNEGPPARPLLQDAAAASEAGFSLKGSALSLKESEVQCTDPPSSKLPEIVLKTIAPGTARASVPETNRALGAVRASDLLAGASATGLRSAVAGGTPAVGVGAAAGTALEDAGATRGLQLEAARAAEAGAAAAGVEALISVGSPASGETEQRQQALFQKKPALIMDSKREFEFPVITAGLLSPRQAAAPLPRAALAQCFRPAGAVLRGSFAQRRGNCGAVSFKRLFGEEFRAGPTAVAVAASPRLQLRAMF